MSDKPERGERVEVQTDTINSGEPFDAKVISVDSSSETCGVEPMDLPPIELAIVGFGEVDRNA